MFFDNLKILCEKSGTTPYELTIGLGLSRNTSSNWKKNGTIPKEEILIKMADKLNCEVSDFFCACGGVVQNGITNIYNTNNGNNNECENISFTADFTTEEKDILSIYRRCNKRQKAELLAKVYGFEEEEKLV